MSAHSNRHLQVAVSSLAMAAAAITSPSNAHAQSGVRGDDREIVVTARKREETSIAVPVILSAVGSAELERRAIVSLDSIARAMPQVLMGDASGGVQGGTIAIRGISTGEQNPFADQAVSLNLDGIQIARASPRRMSQMDLAQIEVLKGPQALFFGKNSPGGVISIRTADPTDVFEAKLSSGYELNAHEWRGEGYVSGPIIDTLGFRVAAYGSTMRGWAKNVSVGNAPHAPAKDTWAPGTKEYAGRLTLKFDPTDNFSIRFKSTYSFLKDHGQVILNERIFCPTGTAQTGDPDDCRANHRGIRGDVGPGPGLAVNEDGHIGEPGGTGARFYDGAPYLRQKQWLSSIEMNYDMGNGLNLTSMTGYYTNRMMLMDNFTWTANPNAMLASSNRLINKEFSQELRLASEWDSPINFLIGTYYQKTDLKYNVRSIFGSVAVPNIPPPAFVTRINALFQKGTAWSFFGQVRWDITPQLELAGGGRFSYEKKSVRGFDRWVEQVVADPKGTWDNFSPEATLTWRPDQNLTVFGAYKTGFLSGGYNSGSGTWNISRKFEQTKIKGFEGGVKTQIGTIRANLGIYNYKLTGMQVSTIVPLFNPDGTPTGATSQLVTNAGGARVKGIELDASWRTPVEGLTLRGAIGYNKARYTDFITTCYPGQTKSLGCNLTPLGPAAPNQTGTLQDLAGYQLVRAPDWNATIGGNFETPISSTWNIGLSGDAFYTSKYWMSATSGAGTRQSGYWQLDATVRVFSQDTGIEFAVIGKNLTDELYGTRGLEVPFSGFGGGTNGPSRFGDVYKNIARGREIMFRASKKF